MRNENINPVIKRIAIKACCIFTSPALIGSGNDENTDNDVLRDSSDKPFLPGSTAAGVLQSLCSETSVLFGSDSRISPLWVFDSEVKGEIIQLDGVALDRENKVALDQNKYDYEAVATGAEFTLRLLLTIRTNDNDEEFEKALKKLVGVLRSNNTAFGAKTKRGFGRVNCDEVYLQEFDLLPDNIEELMRWIDFDWELKTDWKPAESEAFDIDSETLSVNLRLDGSIMIRDTRNIYEDLNNNEKEPDYKHISIGRKPVILGTSWAGAFRSGLYRLLYPKFETKAAEYLDSVFGFVAQDDSQAEVSLVVFGASTLIAKDTGTHGYRTITRVKIDRFTGGAAEGALFTEKPWYGGETTLEVNYPKNREDIRELIILALEGIDKGLIQIGGESAIGRGFFKVLAVNGEAFSKLEQEPKQKLITAIEKAGAAV